MIVFLILVFYVSGRISRMNKLKTLRQFLQENYGTLPENEMRSSDFERIGKYHEKVAGNDLQDCFVIDDITWNDLNMNEIFAMCNATQSSVGEEFLYHMLHCMSLKEDNGFYELMEYFLTHEEDRISMQMELHALGKIKNFSITDILGYAKDLKEEKNLKHYIMDALLLLSIALIFVWPGIGVLMLVVMIAYSVISYYQGKAKITPYFTTFFYIHRMLGVAEKIKAPHNKAGQEELEKLDEIIRSCRVFKKNMFFLSGNVQFSSNIFDLLFDYIRILFHIDIIKFNSMLSFLKTHDEEIETLRRILGKYDAAIAVGNLRKALPELTRPEFVSEKVIEVKEAFHPLLHDPVKNSIRADGGILITGSNASGKSTFIKTVAICALLAQTVQLVPALSYKACRVRLMTSMALTDQILKGESYFIVEIRSLKRILDQSGLNGAPVLCFIDEVLRGTNTVERIAASSRILAELDQKNTLTFAATHDIELTKILKNRFTNYHFEEEIDENDVRFNYRLMEGPSATKNAIRLLALTGFSDEVIREAEEAAADFLSTNRWGVIP